MAPPISSSNETNTNTTNSNNEEEMMIRMSDYSYTLKESSIARYPASPRGSSKLLQVDGSGKVTYFDHFSNHFPSLAHNCHLVFNDSHVLDARLFVHPTATSTTKIELMILDLGEVNLKAPCQESTLRAMIRRSHLEPNQLLRDANSAAEIRVESIQGIWEEDEQSDGNGLDCLVNILSPMPLDAYLDHAGSVPIPPYFQRQAETSDREAYNNVYAAVSGSVAAPTAGLHFTRSVLDQIGKDNLSFLTLHIGAGTFQPVLKENASEHDMHAESFGVPLKELERLLQCLRDSKPLIVVGTTSCRTLESLYWCGVKLLVHNKNNSSSTNGNKVDKPILELGQFEWRELDPHAVTISSHEAFQALVDHYKTCGQENNKKKCDIVIHGRTRLMITPVGYQFRVVDHLVTNFHAPDSTLMLLVCAFLGSPSIIQSVYHQAQDQGYRFLSYGDVCLFSRPGCVLPGVNA